MVTRLTTNRKYRSWNDRADSASMRHGRPEGHRGVQRPSSSPRQGLDTGRACRSTRAECSLCWSDRTCSSVDDRHRARTRSGRFDRVKFTLKLFDPRTGTASFRGEEVLLVENQQSLWWQHKGYTDPSGLLKIVDIGVLVLNARLPNFETVKDNIVSYRFRRLCSSPGANRAGHEG
jgi:hypothetical protein